MKFVRGLLVSFTLFLLVSLVLGMAKTNHIEAADFPGINFYASGGCGAGAECTPSYWYFTFTTATDIPVDGKFVVTFPAEFNVASAAVQHWSGIDGSRSIAVNGQEVTVTRSGDGSVSTPGYKWFRLTGITNPSSGGTYQMSFKTTDASDSLIDGVATTDEVINEVYSVRSLPFTFESGELTRHRILFSHAREIPSDGKVVITFPSGFDVSSATLDSMTGFDGDATLSISDQTITVIRDDLGSAHSYGAVGIRLLNITNPFAEGEYVFTVETTDASDTTIDSQQDSSTLNIVETPLDYLESAVWPTFAHDNQRTGQSSQAGVSYPALAAFSYNVGGSYGNLAVDGDNNVYRAGDVWTGWYEPSNAWKVASDGTLEWLAEVNSSKTFPGPLLANNGQVIFAQSNKNWCGESRFVFVNQSDGGDKWTSTNRDWYGDDCGVLAAGMALSNGIILASSSGPGDFWINANDGSYLLNTGWRGYDIYGSTTLSHDEESVYAMGSGNIRAYDRDAVSQWSRNFGTVGRDSSMAIARDNNVLVPLSDGVLHALNPADGLDDWTYDSGSVFRSNPSVAADGTIYIASEDGVVHALDSDGNAEWTSSTGGAYADSYIVENSISIDSSERIYAVLGSVYSLDPDGTVRWQSRVGMSQPEVVIGANNTIITKSGYANRFYKEWTLDSDTAAYARAGDDEFEVQVTSSMMKSHPQVGDNNNVGLVLADGSTVALSFQETNESGESVWTGTIEIDESLEELEEETITVEASNYETITPQELEMPLPTSEKITSHIFEPSEDGNWDDTYAGHSSTIIKDGSIYKMWYSGHDGSKWRLGHATSTDGITWTRVSGNNCSGTTGDGCVIDLGTSGTWDDHGIWGVTVIKEGSTYKMWYSGYDNPRNRIGYATSSDGITWTKYAGNNCTGTTGDGCVFNTNLSTDWDGYGLYYPTVIKDGSTYKMWYQGFDTTDKRIGHATSTDGITWTRVSGNSCGETTGDGCVMGLGSEGNWDEYNLSADSVLKIDDTYHMYYLGGWDGTGQIGLATSTDGISWTRYEGNNCPTGIGNGCVLGISDAPWIFDNQLDKSTINFPVVLYEDNAYKMWFYASGLGYATSTDGIHWTKRKKLDATASETAYTGITTTFSYTVDNTAPSGNVVINDHSVATSNQVVNLVLDASDSLAGVSQMKVSLNSDLSGADWEIYTSTKTLDLGAVEGSRTVYVQYSDGAGNISETVSDVIELDVTNPVLTPEYLNTIRISSSISDYYWTSGKLTITGVSEPFATIQITVESDPITCVTDADENGSFVCTLSEELPTGYHTVKIVATDRAGNITTYPDLTLGVRVGLAQTGSPAIIYVLGSVLIMFSIVIYRRRLFT